MSNSRVSALAAFLLSFLVLAFCVPPAAAFGAGNIPSYAFLEGKAFRHGDIEDTLQELIKRGAGSAGGFAIASLLSKGSKFGGLDVKRVYFGNWLRDYSQAVDIAGLKKLQLQTILNLCMVLGFLAHGYATDEFEVTADRLGVYLPTEHIDNPKGYGEGEDARKYHPKLRGPVDPRELEIDRRTGMKNYIANESGHWDTSKALVRRTLEQCIHLGRQHRAHGQKQDEYEAYRLLGQLLHTLEDFPAHSNFCELALVSLGHHEVFVHVGDHVRIQSPHGKMVAPLVTGTFGGSDFMHSLLGEATDHISEASVSDLNKEISAARSKSSNGQDSFSILRELLLKLPGGTGGEITREMEGVERIRAGPGGGSGKRPEDMSPQEMHAVLWQVLSFRDSVVKKIENTIEKIPGLGPLVQKLMDSISVFVLTTLEPFLKPLLQTASNGLSISSAEVINTQDQYEVFNDPRASDPTHSYLSKDHFNLILNEPAGQLAKIIVAHTVKLVVKAWDDTSVNVHHLTEDVLSCLFHPDFHDSHSQVQREMMQYMHTWVNSHGQQQQQQDSIIRRLSKDSVRYHRNVRAPAAAGHDDSNSNSSSGGFGDSVGSGQTYGGGVGHDAGIQGRVGLQGYLHGIPGVLQQQQQTSGFGVVGSRRSEGGREPSPTPSPYSAGDSSYHEPPPPSVSSSSAEPRVSYFGTSGSAIAGVPPPAAEYKSQHSHHHQHHHQQHHQHSASTTQVHVRHDDDNNNNNNASFPDSVAPAFPSADPSPSLPSESSGYGGGGGPSYLSHRPDDSGSGYYTPSYAPPPGPPPPPPSSFPVADPYGEQQSSQYYSPPSGPPPPNQYSYQYNYGGGRGGPPTSGGW